MASTARPLPALPFPILQSLARAHHFISLVRANPKPTHHDNLGGELGTLATFASILWGPRTWRLALDHARAEPLPALSTRALRELDRLGLNTHVWVHTIFQDQCTDVVELLDDGDEVSAADAEAEYGAGGMRQIWRQHGYSLARSAVAQIKAVDAGLGEALEWCQGAGLSY
ncbi:hypothetical protein LTR08_007171 [Meristemomyces frigidus]|nr:hypothetical protein LTR08_007171 [Meristemomyces frigidus]